MTNEHSESSRGQSHKNQCTGAPTLEEATTWSRNLHPEWVTNTTIVLMAGTNNIKHENGERMQQEGQRNRKQPEKTENRTLNITTPPRPPTPDPHPTPPPAPSIPPQGFSQRRDRGTTKLNGMLEVIITEADLVHTYAIEGDRDAIEIDSTW